jgi:hypothetical protein
MNWLRGRKSISREKEPKGPPAEGNHFHVSRENSRKRGLNEQGQAFTFGFGTKNPGEIEYLNHVSESQDLLQAIKDRRSKLGQTKGENRGGESEKMDGFDKLARSRQGHSDLRYKTEDSDLLHFSTERSDDEVDEVLSTNRHKGKQNSDQKRDTRDTPNLRIDDLEGLLKKKRNGSFDVGPKQEKVGSARVDSRLDLIFTSQDVRDSRSFFQKISKEKPDSGTKGGRISGSISQRQDLGGLGSAEIRGGLYGSISGLGTKKMGQERGPKDGDWSKGINRLYTRPLNIQKLVRAVESGMKRGIVRALLLSLKTPQTGYKSGLQKLVDVCRRIQIQEESNFISNLKTQPNLVESKLHGVQILTQLMKRKIHAVRSASFLQILRITLFEKNSLFKSSFDKMLNKLDTLRGKTMQKFFSPSEDQVSAVRRLMRKKLMKLSQRARGCLKVWRASCANGSRRFESVLNALNNLMLIKVKKRILCSFYMIKTSTRRYDALKIVLIKKTKIYDAKMKYCLRRLRVWSKFRSESLSNLSGVKTIFYKVTDPNEERRNQNINKIFVSRGCEQVQAFFTQRKRQLQASFFEELLNIGRQSSTIRLSSSSLSQIAPADKSQDRPLDSLNKMLQRNKPVNPLLPSPKPQQSVLSSSNERPLKESLQRDPRRLFDNHRPLNAGPNKPAK